MWFVLAAALTASPQILFTPSDAVSFMVADQTTLPAHRRSCVRYAWIWDRQPKTETATQFAANTALSRASKAIRLPRVADGHLVRIEFDKLYPKEDERKRGLQLWDAQAQQDPYFFVRKDVKVTPYKADDGKTYDFRWVTAFGAHVDPKDGVLSEGMAATSSPIQRADRFTVNSLTTANGGRYYQWADIRKSETAGVTDFRQFQLEHGIDGQLAAKLRAERRAAIETSGVTSRPRAIEAIRGLLGVGAWTEDPNDENTDPKADSLLTLLSPKKDAIEAIFPKPNGFLAFGLFDGKEALQQVVPDNVASDTTIPGSFRKTLQPAISCIRCHEIGKGWRTTKNDALDFLGTVNEGGVRLDIVDDKGAKSPHEAIDRIGGLYQDRLEWLNDARNQYSDAVFQATGGLSVEKASRAIRDVHDGYSYSYITPQVACRELGIGVDEKDAVAMLRRLLPPIEHEDGRIASLKVGHSITRAKWEAVYIDAATRSRPQYLKIAEEAAKENQK